MKTANDLNKLVRSIFFSDDVDDERSPSVKRESSISLALVIIFIEVSFTFPILLGCFD